MQWVTQVFINFVYLKFIFLEHENQGGETWIMIEVTKHIIHTENVKHFHFSNKATVKLPSKVNSMNNGAASVRPHYSPHTVQ